MNRFIEVPSQIIPKILYTFKDYLDTVLVQDVPEDDPTRAITIKLGRVLENPLQKNISVGLTGGDPEDPTLSDKRIDFEDDFKIGSLMATEIGGGCYWWRRGAILVRVFFVRQKYEEEKAFEYAYSFFGRLHKALDRLQFNPFSDDYGESAHPPVYIESTSFSETGGSNQFIWRGKLIWRVLTWKV